MGIVFSGPSSRTQQNITNPRDLRIVKKKIAQLQKHESQARQETSETQQRSQRQPSRHVWDAGSVERQSRGHVRSATRSHKDSTPDTCGVLDRSSSWMSAPCKYVSRCDICFVDHTRVPKHRGRCVHMCLPRYRMRNPTHRDWLLRTHWVRDSNNQPIQHSLASSLAGCLL